FLPIYDKINKKYFTYNELSDLWSIIQDPKKAYSNNFFHRIRKRLLKFGYKFLFKNSLYNSKFLKVPYER
ncbi:hypothetical protein FW426_07250, partial [Campylobacter jejuni]|nr:hypothetical protein [Campylobacter jejuni]